MPQTYFTSDTHFLDFRQVAVFGEPVHLFLRPFKSLEEQDELLIERWNALVKPEDTVWHLGDFTTQEAGLAFRHRLNGTIHLLRGNKEDSFSDELLLNYFDSVQTQAFYTLKTGEEINLVHYPVLAIAEKFNLVGHIHKAWTIQANMLNLGVDVWNWQPVSENEIIHIINAIRNSYDQDCFAAYLPANQANIHRLKKVHTSYAWRELE
jgi:calcineurin-like phosphoesterase family protein